MTKNLVWRSFAAVGVAALLVTACGGDDDNGGGADESADEEFGEALAEASGAGGGGLLIFDGEEIPIASVTCLLEEDTFDVGTVSDNDFRVLVTLGNPLNDVSAQILDSDFLQWFPQGSSGDEAQRDGGTFTSNSTTYFNNTDDRTVQASFTIECP